MNHNFDSGGKLNSIYGVILCMLHILPSHSIKVNKGGGGGRLISKREIGEGRKFTGLCCHISNS